MFYGYGTWLIFALPAMLLALFAQFRVQSAYRKYSQVPNAQGLSGEQVAAILMRNEGLAIGVEHIPGDLTDHYDPRAKVMRLSQGSVRPSVAAMPIIREAVETIASLEPRTAARSHPARPLR